MTKKRITFIAPNLKSGAGIERITSILINHFVELGNEVQLILLWDNIVEFDLPESVKISYLGFRSEKRLTYAVLHISELIKNIEGDYVFSLMNPASDIAILACKLARKKVIVAERNDPRSFPFSKKLRMIRNISYDFADAIVFQTEDQKNYFNKVIRSKGVVICNPIRDNLSEPFSGTRSKRIVTTGRIDVQKNIPLLLSCFARISKKYKDYDLYIYGKGKLEEEMKLLSARLDISDRVHFEGFKTNVEELIKDASIFVLSSDFEGISNSMIEALALGLPTVCTDCPIGGAKQMITDKENGLLVPVGNEDKLFEAIESLIVNPSFAEKLGKEAQKIRQLYPEKVIVNQWLELIK